MASTQMSIEGTPSQAAVFIECPGILLLWAGPFIALGAPKLFNLPTDSFERAHVNVQYVLPTGSSTTITSPWPPLAGSLIMSQFFQTFLEFPPRAEGSQPYDRQATNSHTMTGGARSAMSRLGIWKPATIEQRLDRIESLAAVRQLAYRYAVAIDSRNMDMMVDLFVPDVQVGKGESGREALKRWFTRTMSGPRASCHFVGNHVVDFEDADHAHGIVYCHDELEQLQDGQWRQGMLQYWDNYRRIDGEWYFERRKFHRLYIVDWLTRPSLGAGNETGRSALRSYQLPDAYPSWNEFWDRVAREGV